MELFNFELFGFILFVVVVLIIVCIVLSDKFEITQTKEKKQDAHKAEGLVNSEGSIS